MPAEASPLERLEFQALGTTCALFSVSGAGRARLERGADWVAAMQRRLTRFEPESELSQLNAAAGTWFPVSDGLENLLREALHAWELSGGLVNAAVLPAMVGIGYSRSFAEGPGPTSLQPAQPLPPLPQVLEVVPGRARVEPRNGIDLGGIAKGWLADRLSERLGDNCLVNLGGDLYARGGGPEGEGWPVAFGGTTVLLAGQGAATSSTRKRAWQVGESTLHHLIDPRTGRPAASDLGEVSVVAADATRAECLAKTALLLGSIEAPAFLAANAAAWWLV